MDEAKRNLSIYVHIPFCKRKCNYCDFVSFGGCDIGLQKDYINALCKEIGAFSLIADEYKVVTVFIGGGTPSYIPAEYIGMILEKIRETFTFDDNCEITIEGNPDSLTKDKLILYRQYGVNRLSIGLQSANDEMLKILGRVHNYDQFVAAYSRAREAGFTNINVDVMSGLPGESMESYVRTLARVVAMQPEHISAYSLIVEDGTPLSQNDELLALLPSEEEDRKQYARTKLLLGQSGYERYEISNYAKKGYECRHNLSYWTGGEYLGVGLNSSSYLLLRDHNNVKNVRFKDVDLLEEYIGRFQKIDIGYFEISSVFQLIGDLYTDIQVLKEKDQIEEFMFLGLRCIKGISKEAFMKKFGKRIEDVYEKVLKKYISSGHIIVENDNIYFSDNGIDVSNRILSEFLL